MHSGPRKNIVLAKSAQKKRNCLSRGSTSDAVTGRRAARRMATLRQSRKDTQRLTAGGNYVTNPSSFGSMGRGGAEATSAGRRASRLNLRRPCRVAAWNVLSLRDDNHLPLLSRELGRLGIAIAALSEVRRPKSGEISVGGYTYYWSGRLDGYHSERVTIAI